MTTYRLGVDVGGTFTDVLLIDESSGRTWRAKTASTPEDQSVGVLHGIEMVCAAADVGMDRISEVLHGTTVATNAILEGNWIDRVDGTTEMVPSKVIDVPVEAGDLLHFVTSGGGGWGDPLRERLRAERPDVLPTFDKGPPLETILERALEETGLPAPTPPRRP